MISFLAVMSEQVAIDANNKVTVLRQIVCTTDAEKVCDVIEDYIESLGY